MSASAFVTQLATKINESLDLPFFDNDQEQQGLVFLLSLADPFIPPSLRSFLLDASDGLTSAEIARHKDMLVLILLDKSKQVDLPGVPGWMEHHMFAQGIPLVVDAILDLAKRGLSLDTPEA